MTHSDLPVPNEIATIDEFFDDYRGLKHITFSHNLTRIPGYAFDGYINLESVFVPESLTLVEYRAFKGCKNLDVFIEGCPVCEEEAFSSVHKIIAPHLPLSKLLTTKEKRLAAKGFLSNPSLFTDTTIIDDYKTYILHQKKRLLCEILEEDDVSSLEIYLEIKKHNIKSFGEEFLLPAKKANANNCIAFLLEWEDKNILTLFGLQPLADFL